MNEEELGSLQELIERKLLMAEVMGGLTTQDKKFINLWNYAMQLQNNWNELKKWLEEELKENDTTIKKCDQVIFKMGNENRNDTHQHKLIDVCSRENLIFNRILSKMQELEQGKDG